jgi:hypothetical protein
MEAHTLNGIGESRSHGGMARARSAGGAWDPSRARGQAGHLVSLRELFIEAARGTSQATRPVECLRILEKLGDRRAGRHHRSLCRRGRRGRATGLRLQGPPDLRERFLPLPG